MLYLSVKTERPPLLTTHVLGDWYYMYGGHLMYGRNWVPLESEKGTSNIYTEIYGHPIEMAF